MIDWVRVNALKEDVGSEDFDDIIALFLEEVDGTVARLKMAPNPKTLGADLHFVKGSAAGLGFTDFVDHCQIGEALCKEGKVDQVDLRAIISTYAASKNLFLQEMPKALAS